MIPPELTPFLCRYLDTASLVALYQTNHSWRNVFSERDFKQVLQHDKPWIQLENSTKCCWKRCALENSRDKHVSFEKFKKSFQNYSFPVRYDSPLPDDFYTICKEPLFDTQVRFSDSGFLHTGADGRQISVSLSQKTSELERFEVKIMSDTVTSKFGLKMRVSRDLEFAIHSSTPQVLVTAIVVMDEIVDDRVVDGLYLYVKYNESKDTSEPDCVIFSEFSTGYVAEPTIYTVGGCVFVQTEVDEKIHTCIVRHGTLEVVDVSENEKVGILCYDSSYWVVDSCCWSNTESTCSPVCQDPVLPQYAVFYDTYGFRSHVIDLKNKLTMNLRQLSQGEFVAVPGVTNGRLEVFMFSKAYLEEKMGENQYRDFLRTLNNTPLTCDK